MIQFFNLTIRNIKIFFKDKGMFFASMITPIILLVLYATFLSNVYADSFKSMMPDGVIVNDKLINGIVSGQLFSSLMAVCCITVAFSSNIVMANDRLSGARKDILITPVKKSVLALSYFVSTFITTFIVTFIAFCACLIYVAIKGWYLSAGDVISLLCDVILLTFFGTSFSSLVNEFLYTQGQISAVSAIVSAGYGFICGAYMPISSFSEGLKKVLMFLPGTYGTSLLRNHCLAGVFRQMEEDNFPSMIIDGLRDSIDCNIYFFDTNVKIITMYMVLISAIIILTFAYVLINSLDKKRS